MHRLLPFFATTNNVSLMVLVFGSYNEAKLFLSWSLELKLTGHRVYTSQSHAISLNCSPSFGANCTPSFSPSISVISSFLAIRWMSNLYYFKFCISLITQEVEPLLPDYWSFGCPCPWIAFSHLPIFVSFLSLWPYSSLYTLGTRTVVFCQAEV